MIILSLRELIQKYYKDEDTIEDFEADQTQALFDFLAQGNPHPDKDVEDSPIRQVKITTNTNETPPNFQVQDVDGSPIKQLKTIETPPNFQVQNVGGSPIKQLKTIETPPNFQVQNVDGSPIKQIKTIETPPNCEDTEGSAIRQIKITADTNEMPPSFEDFEGSPIKQIKLDTNTNEKPTNCEDDAETEK